MTEARLTDHANRRLRQRGIPDDVLPLLMRYGAHEYDKHGTRLVYLDHRGKARLRRSLDAEDFRRIERALDVYAVVARDGAIVTVGHRTHRINRN